MRGTHAPRRKTEQSHPNPPLQQGRELAQRCVYSVEDSSALLTMRRRFTRLPAQTLILLRQTGTSHYVNHSLPRQIKRWPTPHRDVR
jgi:hypothetical protein